MTKKEGMLKCSCLCMSLPHHLGSYLIRLPLGHSRHEAKGAHSSADTPLSTALSSQGFTGAKSTTPLPLHPLCVTTPNSRGVCSKSPCVPPPLCIPTCTQAMSPSAQRLLLPPHMPSSSHAAAFVMAATAAAASPPPAVAAVAAAVTAAAAVRRDAGGGKWRVRLTCHRQAPVPTLLSL